MTTEELEQAGAVVRRDGEEATDGLLSIREVANVLGVSRQRAMVLAQREDFPDSRPVYVEHRAWTREAIEEWDRTLRRRPRGALRDRPEPVREEDTHGDD